jgi:D-beta-D-heptose 7-phosphate kinase/D-beta-D-heptose 1-phosphate adenosyltransferase
MARQTGKHVIIDPKGVNYAKYRGASVVTPNLHEAEQAVNYEIDGGADLLEVGGKLLEILQGSAVLITRGPEGMSLFRPGYQAAHIPADARNVFDATGAGDTVISALAMALAAGADLEQAAQLANCAAGIVVGKQGTSLVTIEELSRVIREQAI